MYKNQNQILNLQKLIISKLVPLVQSNYVLLDIPNHGNIGDHLIYEGELIFLRNYLSQYKCTYSSDCHSFNDKMISQDTTILLHGGGNFGDIYDLHQKFRLNIIQKFPDNNIIILPQTVHYNNIAKLKQDCEVFKGHENLFICVRDHKSFEILNNYLDSDQLFVLPDMAFFIDFSRFHKKANHYKRSLLMHRLDVENTGKPDQVILDNLKKDGVRVDIKDWPTYYPCFNIEIYNQFNRIRRFILLRISKMPFFLSMIKNDTNDKLLKKHYLKMGAKFMNKYDIVYTTRLHGLILAILLGKDAVVLDNSYGKLSSFYDAWLSDFEGVSIKS